MTFDIEEFKELDNDVLNDNDYQMEMQNLPAPDLDKMLSDSTNVESLFDVIETKGYVTNRDTVLQEGKQKSFDFASEGRMSHYNANHGQSAKPRQKISLVAAFINDHHMEPNSPQELVRFSETDSRFQIVSYATATYMINYHHANSNV